jgi:hypothetical protein
VSQQESYLVGPPDGRMGGLRDRTSKAIFSGCSNDRRYDPDALASLLGVNPGILSQADVIAFEYNGSRNTNFESSRWMFRGGGSYVKSEHQFDNPTVVSNPTDSNQVIAHGRVDPGKYRSFFDTSTLGSGTVAFLLFDLPDSIVKAPDFKVELYPGKNIQNGTPDIDAVGVLP